MLRSSCVFYRKNVLVFGAAGAMGRGVAATFQTKGWNTVCVDLPGAKAASSADNLIALPATADAGKELEQLVRLLRRGNHGDFSAVVNAAGGWAGGGAADPAIAAQAALMWSQSVRSSILCSHIATTLGAKDGVLLVLTGAAAAANGPTPGMLAYGTAKAAVHHIARSVAGELEDKKNGSAAVCVLPVTIDTPGNRAAMPNADRGSWTPVEEIAERIFGWAARTEQLPPNGALVEASTTKGRTAWVLSK